MTDTTELRRQAERMQFVPLPFHVDPATVIALLDALDRLREGRDRLRKAACWFASNPPGTPVPDEFDGVLDQTGTR